MMTYVILFKWTDQGIKEVKQTVARGQGFERVVQQAGGHVTSLLWTQGMYDIVAAFEVPDEDTAMVIMLGLGTIGTVRTETMRAFSADDMNRILQRLP